MKEYLKNEIKHIPMMLLLLVLFYGIVAFATGNYLFNSSDVEYDNTNSGIQSTNVADAIDELYACASNYSAYNNRLTGVETTIGNSTLTTTNKTLTGAVKELNSNLGLPSSASGVTGADAFSKINTLNSKLTWRTILSARRSGLSETINTTGLSDLYIDIAWIDNLDYARGFYVPVFVLSTNAKYFTYYAGDIDTNSLPDRVSVELTTTTIKVTGTYRGALVPITYRVIGR